MSVYRTKKLRTGQRTIAPQAEGFKNPLVTGEDATALALKSAIPIAELIGSNRRINKFRNNPTKFSRVDLTAPVVRDMARPSFAPRSRSPLGSSLAERTAGQKFGDAYQNAQETNFEIQNEGQKRQQEAQNIGILNQENMTNTQIANQEAQLNANVDMLGYKHSLGRRDVALNALNYYLATDPNQLIQGKHMKQVGRDNYIVQNPDDFTEEEVAASKSRILSVAPTETTAKTQAAREPASRNGRKLKTKFNYGR